MRISIGTKLYGMAGLTVLGLAAVTGISLYGVNRQVAETETIVQVDAAQVDVALKSQVSLSEAVRAYKNYLVRKDDKHVTGFRESIGTFEKNIAEFEKLANTDGEKAAVGKAKEELGKYRGCIDELVAARSASDDVVAIDRNLARGIDRPLEASVKEMEKVARQSFEMNRAVLAASSKRLLVAQSVFSVIVALLAAGFGFNTARRLVFRLGKFSEMIARVADSDLTTRVVIRADDELGDMGRTFNRMVENFEHMLTSIQNAVLNLSESARTLSVTSEQIATGAEEMASQTGTVATASEEMAATSMEIAQNCSTAADVARHASASARSGAAVVQQTIGAMERITERVRDTARTVEALGARSDQIGEIVGTIQDIADQTNLLALNAAIEAARAGEQGRGFAVVADEVRALAERTTRATREIAEMIKSIQQETRGAVASMEEGVVEVTQGSADAARSGDALREILDQIEQVTGQVAQIATAAEQQTATTSEITMNIQQITEVVGHTAREAGESADAATGLATLADELQTEVRTFKTSGSELFILELAKKDHGGFVATVEAVLDGRRRMEAGELSTHHTCRFGKWYEGDGRQLCGHLASYKAIYAPHERIHSLARDVVAAVNGGDRDRAARLFPELKELSREIVTRLDDIRREFEAQRAAA
ncbi:methyl-accepting chemotaxis protein [Geobacter sulfurreducens]|uniref:methyl-accepting chemotaxis protein n=1 Tax=Geobacter sulfurreducens TaxID=35554 RepID=UPI000DBB5288|nr:methyl-accepting chemotaxis protein [Geobacter sulfurreducens]BBA69565.1 Methyl-accepting chemotaxis protein PctA [Geobacter sulfurreducens]